MEMLNLVRELAKKIKKHELVQSYNNIQKSVDADIDLQEQIKEFNLKKINLNSELSKDGKDKNKITRLNSEIEQLYAQITSNDNMVALNDTKVKLDEFIKNLNYIIIETINGANPDEINTDIGRNCGSGCSICGKCC